MTGRLVRPLAAGDAPAAARIFAGSEPWATLGFDPAGWERRLADPGPGREGWVLAVDGEVAAVAVVRPGFLHGDYLELLAVAAAARGRGHGGALLAHVEAVAFARSANLFACVSDFNRGARRFYAARGFEEIGALRDLLVGGFAEILLRKSTGPVREGPHRGG